MVLTHTYLYRCTYMALNTMYPTIAVKSTAKETDALAPSLQSSVVEELEEAVVILEAVVGGSVTQYFSWSMSENEVYVDHT